MTPTLSNPYWTELANEHRQWLGSFHPQHLANWEKVLNGDVEAGLCEATIRRYLQGLEIHITPNEGLSGKCGGPDFRCESEGHPFYLEVTCITVATAANKTGISVEPNPNGGAFNGMGMTDAIWSECGSKAKQCADLDGPALLAVGTFHSFAAMACFQREIIGCSLTGKTKMAWDVDMKTGRSSKTYQITELESAAFLRPDPSEEVGYARSSISGLLMCSLGVWPITSLGVLHPNPARPFAAVLLPDIEFGEVEIDRSSKELRVHWPSRAGASKLRICQDF